VQIYREPASKNRGDRKDRREEAHPAASFNLNHFARAHMPFDGTQVVLSD
jgi:hypothetical protein